MAIVALIAYLVVDFLGGEPIYESLLARLRLPDQLSALRGRLEEMTFVVAPPVVRLKMQKCVNYNCHVVFDSTHSSW